MRGWIGAESAEASQIRYYSMHRFLYYIMYLTAVKNFYKNFLQNFIHIKQYIICIYTVVHPDSKALR